MVPFEEDTAATALGVGRVLGPGLADLVGRTGEREGRAADRRAAAYSAAAGVTPLGMLAVANGENPDRDIRLEESALTATELRTFGAHE